jgi:flavin-dependent dehydrogenase
VSAASKSYDVIIAGGGPAGSSAAIHLASRDFSVLLVEKSTFPRPKLCGEFISPECVQQFEKLGVANQMDLSQPALIKETVFFSRRGRKTVVPSSWFGGGAALGLSRATMDDNLLNRARAIGVDVLDGATVTKVLEDKEGARGVGVKNRNGDFEYGARIVVDATGRARALARKVETRLSQKPKLVAFKAHLENTNAPLTACEIYSYPGGYGGVSTIEKGLSNLCFIIDATHVKEACSDPEAVLRRSVMRNPRAAFTLSDARVCTEWLSVAIESFGRYRPTPIRGLLAIGDAASFIDPFTGSGMLMALESGDLVAQTIVRHQHKLEHSIDAVGELCSDYSNAYRKKFDSRLRICGMLRRVAFRPMLAQLTISVCASSDLLSNWLARATRSSLKQNAASTASLK